MKLKQLARLYNKKREIKPADFEPKQGEDGSDGYTPKLGKDYFTDEDKAYIISEVKKLIPNPKDGVDGIDGKDGKDGIGKDGKDGADGKDGYTPKKGKDYFTKEDIESIVGLVASEIEIPDGVSIGDVEDVIEEYVSNVNVTPEFIRDSLQLLKGEDRLDASAIKNLDKYVSKTVQVGGGAGSRTFEQLLDTPNSYSGNAGKVVIVNDSESGLEFGNGVSTGIKYHLESTDSIEVETRHQYNIVDEFVVDSGGELVLSGTSQLNIIPIL
jgi:hypothetical protein